MSGVYSGALEETVYIYRTSQGLDAEGYIKVMLGTDWRERNMHTTYKSIHMMLGELVSICTAGFWSCSKRNVELNLFSILASYCCDIPEVIDCSERCHVLSVRKPGVRCLSTLRDIRLIRFMAARNMVYVCQSKARRENVMSC